MTDLATWANILLFPVGVLAVALFVQLVHRRDEARWAREAREKKGSGTPAE